MTQPTAALLALADFNDARLDEDEAVAAAAHGPIDAPIGVRWWSAEDIKTRLCDDQIWMHDAEHMARQTPARVLAEIAAKRLLIANWRKLILAIDAETDPEKRDRLALTRHGLDQVAFQFAAVHREHPDYQQSWRP